MLLCSTQWHLTAISASKILCLFNPLGSEFIGELESAVYSFQQAKSEYNKPIYFGILYHSKETQRHFITHGFKTVPYLTVSLQKQKRLEYEEFYKEEDRWLVRPDQIYEVSKVIEFLNGRLSTNVKLSLPFTTILIKNFTFLAIAIVAAILVKYLRQAMLMPSVWFAIAMITYLICTSGVVYSIIHNVPWFKMDRDQYG